MRIYIKDYNIKNIINKLHILEKYYNEYDKFINIYSSEGIYFITNNILNKINYNDKKIIYKENYYDKKTIIIDNSNAEYEETCQIPPNHLKMEIHKYSYFIDKKSKIKLVIECDKDLNKTNILIYDLYLELPEKTDVDDVFVKKDLIVFLSLLN